MNHSKTTVLSAGALMLIAGTAAAQIDKAALGALAASHLATGVLQITTSDAQQQIEIEVGPVAGEVRVWGVDGIPSGTTFYDITEIDLRTGAAQDYVEFRMYAAESPLVNVDTRTGNSDVKFIYLPPFTVGTVASEVNVLGGPDNDKVAFEVFSNVDHFMASWNVRHGNGDNEAIANIDSPEMTGSVLVDFSMAAGQGQDKYDLSVKTGGAIVDVAADARLGAGNDTAIVVIDEQRAGMNALALDINLGAGDDNAEALAVLRGGLMTLTGTLAGGGGNDTLKSLLEGSGTSDLRLAGGAGNDTLDSEYKGSVSGAPRLLGATGDDFLKIVAEQPAGLSPYLNGGAGYDEAIGFGTFVAIEKIN